MENSDDSESWDGISEFEIVDRCMLIDIQGKLNCSSYLLDNTRIPSRKRSNDASYPSPKRSKDTLPWEDQTECRCANSPEVKIKSMLEFHLKPFFMDAFAGASLSYITCKRKADVINMPDYYGMDFDMDNLTRDIVIQDGSIKWTLNEFIDQWDNIELKTQQNDIVILSLEFHKKSNSVSQTYSDRVKEAYTCIINCDYRKVIIRDMLDDNKIRMHFQYEAKDFMKLCQPDADESFFVQHGSEFILAANVIYKDDNDDNRDDGYDDNDCDDENGSDNIDVDDDDDYDKILEEINDIVYNYVAASIDGDAANPPATIRLTRIKLPTVDENDKNRLLVRFEDVRSYEKEANIQNKGNCSNFKHLHRNESVGISSCNELSHENEVTVECPHMITHKKLMIVSEQIETTANSNSSCNLLLLKDTEEEKRKKNTETYTLSRYLPIDSLIPSSKTSLPAQFQDFSGNKSNDRPNHTQSTNDDLQLRKATSTEKHCGSFHHPEENITGRPSILTMDLSSNKNNLLSAECSNRDKFCSFNNAIDTRQPMHQAQSKESETTVKTEDKSTAINTRQQNCGNTHNIPTSSNSTILNNVSDPHSSRQILHLLDAVSDVISTNEPFSFQDLVSPRFNIFLINKWIEMVAESCLRTNGDINESRFFYIMGCLASFETIKLGNKYINDAEFRYSKIVGIKTKVKKQAAIFKIIKETFANCYSNDNTKADTESLVEHFIQILEMLQPFPSFLIQKQVGFSQATPPNPRNSESPIANSNSASHHNEESTSSSESNSYQIPSDNIADRTVSTNEELYDDQPSMPFDDEFLNELLLMNLPDDERRSLWGSVLDADERAKSYAIDRYLRHISERCVLPNGNLDKEVVYNILSGIMKMEELPLLCKSSCKDLINIAQDSTKKRAAVVDVYEWFQYMAKKCEEFSCLREFFVTIVNTGCFRHAREA